MLGVTNPLSLQKGKAADGNDDQSPRAGQKKSFSLTTTKDLFRDKTLASSSFEKRLKENLKQGVRVDDLFLEDQTNLQSQLQQMLESSSSQQTPAPIKKYIRKQCNQAKSQHFSFDLDNLEGCSTDVQKQILISILSKSPERRTLADISFVSSYLMKIPCVSLLANRHGQFLVEKLAKYISFSVGNQGEYVYYQSKTWLTRAARIARSALLGSCCSHPQHSYPACVVAPARHCWSISLLIEAPNSETGRVVSVMQVISLTGSTFW